MRKGLPDEMHFIQALILSAKSPIFLDQRWDLECDFVSKREPSVFRPSGFHFKFLGGWISD